MTRETGGALTYHFHGETGYAYKAYRALRRS